MSQSDQLQKAMDFILEIEKLKNVYRKTRPKNLNRYENSAEHSWHVCMAAIALEDFSNQKIDINKVIRMLLIHDLGEILAGDYIVYESHTPEVKAKELEGVKTIFSHLTKERATELLNLWLEFEASETPEAQFAKSIDRIPPLLQNLNDNGHSWVKHGILFEQVIAVNTRVKQGCGKVWTYLEKKLQEAKKKGYFHS